MSLKTHASEKESKKENCYLSGADDKMDAMKLPQSEVQR